MCTRGICRTASNRHTRACFPKTQTIQSCGNHRSLPVVENRVLWGSGQKMKKRSEHAEQEQWQLPATQQRLGKPQCQWLYRGRTDEAGVSCRWRFHILPLFFWSALKAASSRWIVDLLLGAGDLPPRASRDSESAKDRVVVNRHP